LAALWANDVVRRRLLLLGSAIGYGLGLAAAITLIVRAQGGIGYDSQAYWLAGQNVLHGRPLYSCVEVDCFGGFKYPPLFAQLWAPFTLMPALAFSWLWRAGCVLCLRRLAGSWLNVGLWLLVPFTITELSLANVTFPVALAVVSALRGQRAGAWLAAGVAALKFGPALVMPYLWLTRQQRRPLVTGVLVFAAICLASFAFDPAAWSQYADSLFRSTSVEMNGAGVIALAPSGAFDFGLRLAIALAMTAVAIRLRSDRLVFVATVIAVPILAIWRLAPLLVLPRLRRAELNATAEPREAAAPGQ
jgi:hypothetical protein